MNIVRKIVIYGFILGLILGLAGASFLIYHYNTIQYDSQKLINYTPDRSSLIYDRKGEVIANLFEKNHRLYAPYNDIPVKMIEALVAIEDTAFYKHDGVNYEAIGRAVFLAITTGKLRQGGSTLTQQLVKNVLLTNERSLKRKINEAILSLKIEKILSKEQILEIYLNEIYFGHSYYGVRTASLGYFHKELNELNLKEIAMLIGLPKAPSAYAPTKNYKRCIKRADNVLWRMRNLGWLDQETYKEMIAAQPEVFNDTITINKAPYIVDEVVRNLINEYPDIKTGGYKIYTTIDLTLQNFAKEALEASVVRNHTRTIKRTLYSAKKRKKSKKQIKALVKKVDKNYAKLEASFTSIDSKTGEILALVGGRSYAKSPFNRATQSIRQPGSAFKPFLYQIALNHGSSGYTSLIDIARSYGSGRKGTSWNPQNYEKNYKGYISLREALIHSRNLATINLVTDIGFKEVTQNLKDFGFTNLPKNLSMSLGSMSISPLELSEYYTVISNYGERVDPYLITKVQTSQGETFTFESNSSVVNSADQAYLMIDIMKDVVKRGTGRNAQVANIELAGKTGTTNNYKDAWFCGFSPRIQSIVWFGNDDNAPMKGGRTGGALGAPAFKDYYTKLIKYMPHTPRKFRIPEGVTKFKIDGKDEYFTKTSKFPRVQEIEDELIF